MQEHLQTEPLALKGYWWTPNGEKVAGEFLYDEESLELCLFGGFGEPENGYFPVVHGLTIEGGHVTLFDLFYTNRQGWSSSKLMNSTLNCNFATLGGHFEQSTLFSYSELEIPKLSVWLEQLPFKSTEMDQSLQHATLHYERPPNLEFDLSDFKLRIGSVVKLPKYPSESPGFEHSSRASINSSGHTLQWHIEKSNELIDFFSVAYGQPINSRRLLVKQSSNGSHALEVFFSRHRVEAKEIRGHEMMIRFGAMHDQFHEILSKWFASKGAFKRARRMLCAAEKRPSSFIEIRFLILAHALEVLSQTASNESILDEAAFKLLKSQVMDVCKYIPDELQQSIRQSLSHVNSRPLKRKILALLADLDLETRNLVCVNEDAFVKGTVNSRNHYTHYSAKIGSNVLQGIELHWTTHKLALLLRILILKTAGVPEARLREAIRSNPELARKRIVWSRLNESGSEYHDPTA